MLEEARTELEDAGQRTILFVDELHRFNRAQQDVLLPDVEEGRIMLIGATTQNPFFAVNSPLRQPQPDLHIRAVDQRADQNAAAARLADRERGLGNVQVDITDEALDFLAEISDGDARRALTALEVGVLSAETKPVEFTVEVAQDSIQRKAIDYDATGDAHYDVASAFIKSMRGSDPDAAIYWLARMLEAGEDPRFIARRLVILASEDIGNADPQALLLATAAAQAVEIVGMPECQLTLAQAVTYLATAPKSNAATLAIGKAREDVHYGRTLAGAETSARFPLRGGRSSSVTAKATSTATISASGWVDQAYLPEERRYYEPVDRGFEAEIRKRMEALREKSPPS